MEKPKINLENYKESLDFILNTLGLSESLLLDFANKGTVLSLNKKELLSSKIIDGTEKFAFVISGIFRKYYTKENNKEITFDFFKENEFFTLELKDKNFQTEIQALETSEVFLLDKSDMYQYYLSHQEVNFYGRMLTEKYLEKSKKYIRILIDTNATERYRYFKTENDDLLNRVSLKYIASYLGITMETLSRIRSNEI